MVRHTPLVWEGDTPRPSVWWCDTPRWFQRATHPAFGYLFSASLSKHSLDVSSHSPRGEGYAVRKLIFNVDFNFLFNLNVDLDFNFFLILWGGQLWVNSGSTLGHGHLWKAREVICEDSFFWTRIARISRMRGSGWVARTFFWTRIERISRMRGSGHITINVTRKPFSSFSWREVKKLTKCQYLGRWKKGRKWAKNAFT